MGTFISNTINRFKQGGILLQFIYLNVALFLLIHLAEILCLLFRWVVGFGVNLNMYFCVSAQIGEFIRAPWTIFTYMFVHDGLWHILFNMLWLNWFGTLFLRNYHVRQFGGLYIFGGFLGAVFFLLAYNFLPGLVGSHAYLFGSSASIMAIVAAVGLAIPNEEISLFLIGRVKIKYVVIATIVISLFGLGGANFGGNIAHIGGFTSGCMFVLWMRRGRNLLIPFNRMIDWVVGLFQRKSTMHIKYKRPKQSAEANPDYEYNYRQSETTKEVDHILDKLREGGYEKLTADEKQKLFKYKQ